MISWDISAAGDRWTKIDEELRATLKPYSWVRPLKTVYVVKLNDETQRNLLQATMTAVAKTCPEKVHFLMTPLIQGGSYNGYLPKDSWEKINARTVS